MDVLFDQDGHKNIVLDDLETGLAVQANQHLIMHDGRAMLLDPGGHKVYARVLSQTLQLTRGGRLDYIFLSHQDPDIVAAVNGWLMTTDAKALCPKLWFRFIPHFGLDHLLEPRMDPIPDEGRKVDLGGQELWVLPAHFLHSCGNFQVYDPTSKILYSGDLGASLGADSRFVQDFDAHLPFMEGFHRRYMTSNAVLRAWVRMVEPLEIETIAPQHGAMFRGRSMVDQFLKWCWDLPCGVDLMGTSYQLPVE